MLTQARRAYNALAPIRRWEGGQPFQNSAQAAMNAALAGNPALAQSLNNQKIEMSQSDRFGVRRFMR